MKTSTKYPLKKYTPSLTPKAEPIWLAPSVMVWANPSPSAIKVLEKLIVSLVSRTSLSKNSLVDELVEADSI